MAEQFNPVFADDGSVRTIVAATDRKLTTTTASREMVGATSRAAKTITPIREVKPVGE